MGPLGLPAGSEALGLRADASACFALLRAAGREGGLLARGHWEIAHWPKIVCGNVYKLMTVRVRIAFRVRVRTVCMYTVDPEKGNSFGTLLRKSLTFQNIASFCRKATHEILSTSASFHSYFCGEEVLLFLK